MINCTRCHMLSSRAVIFQTIRCCNTRSPQDVYSTRDQVHYYDYSPQTVTGKGESSDNVVHFAWLLYSSSSDTVTSQTRRETPRQQLAYRLQLQASTRIHFTKNNVSLELDR